MILLKVRRIDNHDIEHRFIKSFNSMEECDEYCKEVVNSRFYKDTVVTRVSSIDDISMEDCANNSLKTILKIFNMENAMTTKGGDNNGNDIA